MRTRYEATKRKEAVMALGHKAAIILLAGLLCLVAMATAT